MIICPRELRIYARAKISSAIISDKLVPARSFACADCGEPATRYDHRDYTKPFDVEPVCHTCDNHRGQGLPDIDGPCVDVEWTIRKKPSKCGECFCPMFGNPSERILNGITKRKKVWT